MIRLYICFIFSLSLTCLAGQEDFLQPLKNILFQIEDHYDVILNYDENLVSEYTLDAELVYKSLYDDLDWALRNTPLTFDLGEKISSIYLASPMQYKVCGQVADISGSPLPYASVIIADTRLGDDADDNGNYSFELFGNKNDSISISFLGYETKELLLGDYKKGCITTLLMPDRNLFSEEIVIRDYIRHGVTLSEDYTAVELDITGLNNKASSTEYDMMQTLQLLPGVSSVDESATNLNIRGSSPDQNLILWEDVTLYDPGHLFGMISSVNPFLVSKVRLHKGVYNPRYSNRVGGLIDMSLPDINTSNSYGGGISMTEAHAFSSFTLADNKIGIHVGGRHSINFIRRTRAINSYVGKVFQNTKVDDNREDIEEGFLDADNEINFYDLNAKVVMRPHKKLQLSMSGLLVDNRFNYITQAIERDFETQDFLDYNQNILASHLKVIWSENLMTHLNASVSSYQNNYKFVLDDDDLDDTELIDLNIFNDIQDRTFSIDNELLLNKGMKINMGFIYDQKKVRYEFEEEFEFEEDYKEFNNEEAQFLHFHLASDIHKGGHEISLGYKTSLPIGEALGCFHSPRIAYRFGINDHFSILASGGRFYQFINQVRDIGSTEINSSLSSWTLSTLQDRDQLFADKMSFGFLYRKAGWLVELDAYYHKTYNLFVQNNSMQVAADEFDVEQSSEGLELLIKKQWSKAGIWFNYSLSENLYSITEEEINIPTEIDQRHKLSLIADVSISDFNISATYRYKSGLPFSLPSGYEQVDEDNYEIEFEDGLNNFRLNDYSRLDLGLSWQRPLGDYNAYVSLSFLNVLNRRHTSGVSYYIESFENDYGDTEIEQAEVRRFLLGFTPRMMVRFAF